MNSSKTFDIAVLGLISLLCFAVITIGGLEHPHTLAGQVAKFVFSLR